MSELVKCRHVDCETQLTHGRTCDPCREGDCECTACIVCQRRKLRDDERQTCWPCVNRVREHLADVVDMTRLAEQELLDGAYGAPQAPRNGARTAEIPLVGGQVLPLVSGGSQGRTQLLPGADHIDDERPDDPQSVAWELARWEDDWRLVRHEPAGGPVRVRTAARYLNNNLTWAARHHLAFDEFASDVRSLRSRLASALGMAARPLRSKAKCFDCDEPLERRDRVMTGSCPHGGRPRRWLTRSTATGLPQHLEPDASYDLRVAAWEARHARCDRGGLAEEWSCPRCGKTYTQDQYHVAVRARLDQQEAESA